MPSDADVDVLEDFNSDLQDLIRQIEDETPVGGRVISNRHYDHIATRLDRSIRAAQFYLEQPGQMSYVLAQTVWQNSGPQRKPTPSRSVEVAFLGAVCENVARLIATRLLYEAGLFDGSNEDLTRLSGIEDPLKFLHELIVAALLEFWPLQEIMEVTFDGFRPFQDITYGIREVDDNHLLSGRHDAVQMYCHHRSQTLRRKFQEALNRLTAVRANNLRRDHESSHADYSRDEGRAKPLLPAARRLLRLLIWLLAIWGIDVPPELLDLLEDLLSR